MLDIHEEADKTAIFTESTTMNETTDTWTAGLNESDRTVFPNSEETLLPNNTYLNDTLAHDSIMEYPMYMKIYVTLICSVILVVGVLGNLSVPLVIWKTDHMRSSTKIFLANLAIADLFILIFWVPNLISETHKPPASLVIAAPPGSMLFFLQWMVTYASVFTFLAIALDRYYAICKPLTAHFEITSRRAFYIVICLWVISGLASVPLFIWDNSEEYWWAAAFFLFLVPVLLVFIYAVIIRHLMVNAPSGTCVETAKVLARKQVLKMIVAILLVYIICLIPYYVFTVWVTLYHDLPYDWETNKNIFFFCDIMAYVNSTVNPIIYNIMSSKFREAFFRLFSCQKRKNAGCEHELPSISNSDISRLATSSM